jgi:uncharacterized membrane protein YoaK (UPF0700 family)
VSTEASHSLASAVSATNPSAKAAIGTTAPEPRLLTVGLAFTAAFVDTLGFVALFSFFTAHVTGNFVVLGSALSQPVHGLVAKLLALPTFIIAVAAVRLYGRSLGRRNHAAAVPLLILQGTFLLLFMTLGLFTAPITDADAPLAILTALSGTVAMGVQNAASRTVFASLSPTTVMTGNVTQLVIDAVDLIAGGHAATLNPVRARFRHFWPPVVGFAVGAACGALGYKLGGFASLLVPTAVVFALAIHARVKAHP